MKINYDKKFTSDLSQIKNRKLKQEILAVIEEIKSADSISEIHELKFMINFPQFFCIRLGNYRMGCMLLANNEILAIVFQHRETIYESFP